MVADTCVTSLSEWRTTRKQRSVVEHLSAISGHLARGETVAQPVAFVLALVDADGRTEVLHAGLTTESLPAAQVEVHKRLTEALRGSGRRAV